MAPMLLVLLAIRDKASQQITKHCIHSEGVSYVLPAERTGFPREFLMSYAVAAEGVAAYNSHREPEKLKADGARELSC